MSCGLAWNLLFLGMASEYKEGKMEVLMHGHHMGLLSVMPLGVRLTEIKNKPIKEQPLRNKLIQSVPLNLLPAPVLKAAKARDKAAKAWDKARDKAAKARDDFTTVCLDHIAELEALHNRLCKPDCPWDGERIVGIGN